MRHFSPLDNNVSPARLARHIDRLCDLFEAGWKRGRRPRLERYLGHVPPSAQPELLRELLVLELEYRPQKGEKPELDEYHRRFPEHAELIGAVFQEVKRATPSNPYLLRKWAVTRLASQMRMLALSPNPRNVDRPGVLSVIAGILGQILAETYAARPDPKGNNTDVRMKAANDKVVQMLCDEIRRANKDHPQEGTCTIPLIQDKDNKPLRIPMMKEQCDRIPGGNFEPA
jgi:hypothetical protein